MASTKYLVVGGGLAAVEAVKQLRTLDATGTITLVSQEQQLPYDHPPLSKEFLRGEVPERKVYLAPESFYRKNKIELKLGLRAEGLDPVKSVVAFSNGERLQYERLLIATGGEPVRLNVPGAKLKGVHYFRTIDDSKAVAAEAGPKRRAVLIGAGFIGLEVAASLTQKGTKVTVLEAMPQIWSRFADKGLAGFIQKYCEKQGVSFVTGATVTALVGSNKVSAVKSKDGTEYPCDFVVIGVGIRPYTELALAGGLQVDNGIVVNEWMQTSHANIFAAGDVANYPDPIFGKRRRVEHWGHAEHTGQIAGMNMAGKKTPYTLLTYVWSEIFDLHLEFAGDETEHDQVLTRGKMERPPFTVLYLKKGVLQAYFAVNSEETEFSVLKRLIEEKTDLSKRLKQLVDVKFKVESLASS